MSTAQLEVRHPKVSATKPIPAPIHPPSSSGAAPTAAQGSKWWIWLIVLAVIGGGVFGVILLVHSAKAGGGIASTKSRAVHNLPVVTVTVRTGDLNLYLIGLGTVTPLNTVTVKSRVDGEIMKIDFTEGQTVKKGDLLFEIDPRPYDAALKQAQGQLAKDQATKESADWNVKQDEEAIKTHSIAELQLHTDTATRDQAAGAIEIDEAAIDTANLNITYSKITSPIDGRIGLRLVDIGNIVHAADTTGLVVITQEKPITVVFNLPEDDIAKIQKRVSTGVPLVVDAYDRALTEKLAGGKLMAIDNEIDPSTGTVKIKSLFDNQDGALFPSQFVNARMLVDTVTNAVLVPTAAIQHTPTASFVYVFKKDNSPTTKPAVDKPATDKMKSSADPGMAGRVTIRDITVGQSQAAIGPDEEDTTAIISGLQPGEIVVTDGVDKLLEGTKVLAHSAESTAKRRSEPTTKSDGATTRPSGRRGGHKQPAAE